MCSFSESIRGLTRSSEQTSAGQNDASRRLLTVSGKTEREGGRGGRSSSDDWKAVLGVGCTRVCRVCRVWCSQRSAAHINIRALRRSCTGATLRSFAG